MAHWTIADIPWDDFDPARLDPDIIRVAKAAAMVEKNAADYAAYLCNVFADDETFCRVARVWAREEVQHGDALGRWAERADPDFDFAARFAVFQEGYKIPVNAAQSVRGSRAGELVARCVVEVGTSSYYTALGAAADEPVLKAICAHIAADEFRHYKLFHAHLQRYRERENLGLVRRLAVALGRIAETDDDELSYAYYAGNNAGEPYDRAACAAAYGVRASGFYRPPIVARAAAMTLKAVGFRDDGFFAGLAGRLAWGAFSFHRWRLGRGLAG